MLARPDVLVACRWFRDADGFEYYSDDEVDEDFDDVDGNALRVTQLQFGAGDQWIGQSPL